MKNLSHTLQLWTTTLALGALMSFTAQASVVLSNQSPRNGGGLYISMPDFQNAESFQLGFAASITAVRWYGTEAGADTFTVRFFDSIPTSADNFTPQSGLGTTLTRTPAPLLLGSAGANFPIFEYELTLASAYATVANQAYYVSIHSLQQDWGWLDSAQGDGVSLFRGQDGADWDSAAPDLSLTVIGNRTGTDVPEPTSLALVGLALAAAANARRRRQS